MNGGSSFCKSIYARKASSQLKPKSKPLRFRQDSFLHQQLAVAQIVGLDVGDDVLFVITMRGWGYRNQNVQQFELLGKVGPNALDWFIHRTLVSSNCY
ncbi:hypothetical protein Poly59_00200 [Rubripirellula reticaptiva]|uniref:Uncharacterized protein n=1 Tax=Rubripirellula reticaptiva TaxID=2528013 RepID=A0A5C6F7B6_9BACT|nr:hypothetical protein Poly59_00200 [Rubripirellula reticaptiva]